MRVLSTFNRIILVLIAVGSFSSQALDFEKEISKREVISVKLRQDLQGKRNEVRGADKGSKKQDLRVVLIPKSQSN